MLLNKNVFIRLRCFQVSLCLFVFNRIAFHIRHISAHWWRRYIAVCSFTLHFVIRVFCLLGIMFTVLATVFRLTRRDGHFFLFIECSCCMLYVYVLCVAFVCVVCCMCFFNFAFTNDLCVYAGIGGEYLHVFPRRLHDQMCLSAIKCPANGDPFLFHFGRRYDQF